MTGVRVLHVITALPTGGAELMLYKLLSRTRSTAAVVSLTTEGVVGPRIRELGVPLFTLGMPSGVPDPRGLWRLAGRIRAWRPQVVQTWMYHADLLGGVTARLFPALPLAWNIRQSDLDPATSKRHTILTAKLCAPLSRVLPHRIVSCSHVARRIHVELGYADDRFVVIPNGFDVERLRPDPAARAAVRRELGIADHTPLVGLMARWDAQKDHRNFVRAAARLLEWMPDTHFVLAGTAIDDANPELSGWIAEAGIGGRVHLLGRRDDIPRLTAALDLATSSSAYGEGFSNTVGEAMACGVPCVVTDVGDSGHVVGDTGVVVPPRDPAALAAGWRQLLSLDAAERDALAARVRERVCREYSLDVVADRYDSLHESMMVGR